MRLIAGNKLTDAQQAQVKERFTKRWTLENGYCPGHIPVVTDAQWIANRRFHIKADGNLALKPSGFVIVEVEYPPYRK